MGTCIPYQRNRADCGGTYTFTGSTLATASETNVLQTVWQVALIPATAAIGVASTIIINGEEFTFAETDTFGDVKNAIDARCYGNY